MADQSAQAMSPQRFEYHHTVEGTVHIHVHVHFDNVDTSKLRDATASLKAAVAANQPQPPVPLS